MKVPEILNLPLQNLLLLGVQGTVNGQDRLDSKWTRDQTSYRSKISFLCLLTTRSSDSPVEKPHFLVSPLRGFPPQYAQSDFLSLAVDLWVSS